jgi:hypothetical protein
MFGMDVFVLKKEKSMDAKKQDDKQIPMQARECGPADNTGVAPAEVVLAEQRADDREGTETATRLYVP